jgi:hypothetical protein
VRIGGELIIVKGLRGTSTIACKVLNRSKGGALIKVDCADAVPDDFYLTLPTDRERRIICTVVRRGKTVVGVRFVSQPDYDVRVLASHVS